MRRPVIAGNWKMNKTIVEAVDLAKKLKIQLAEVKDRTVVVCPPYPSLQAVSDELHDSDIAVGGQNLFWEDSGAYTGEVSGPMLKSAGCTYVIIGHSERRQFFGETNESVNRKLLTALKNCLLSIVCVGETLEQREKGETFKVIEKQIKEGTKGLGTGDPSASLGAIWGLVIIAYEPVWAIGTGKVATVDQAEEIHAFIRKLLPPEVAQQVRILYGGSVKPDNIKELMAQKDIDGALVGGASLKAEDFAAIVKY